MRLKSLFLVTANNNTYAIPFTDFQYQPVVRSAQFGALRGLAQRRLFAFGGKYDMVNVTCELYPVLLEALFEAIGSVVTQNNKRSYYLDNSNSISSNNKVQLRFETSEGQKLQTGWGVVSELQISLPSDSFSKCQVSFVFPAGISQISSLPSITNVTLLTPRYLSGTIFVGNEQKNVLINALKVTYQRNVQPKVTNGVFSDFYVEQQTVDFELSLLASSYSKVSSQLTPGTKAKLQVNVAGLYAIIFPEFYVGTIGLLYSNNIISLSCVAVGDAFTQIQLIQL